ncbi:MAG: dihydroorotase [Burkholderiales bacterium]|nr:dihydroorotase [Burkholderiales bacterium]
MSARRTAILGARVIDPSRGFDAEAGIYIEGEKIAAVGTAPAGFQADQTIEAAGCVVSPGFVDLCARLREPGGEFKNALASEMHAAVAGGITTLVCSPDTDPVLDEPGLVEMLRFRAKNLRGPRVFPAGALTEGLKGERLTEMAELREHGCVAFSQADAALTDTQVMLRAMQYAATFGFVVMLRPDDAWLSKDGVAHEGQVAARLGLTPILPEAETIGLMRILELARLTGARLHVARLSCARSLDLIRAAKAQGLAVTCDVAVHHAHLTEMDIGYFDALCRVVPPFRTQRDRDAIRAALKDGTIDAVCSDHAPVDEDEKALPFGEAEPGVTAVELLLPLMLKWAHEDGVPMARALELITSGPARVLGLPYGRLVAGCAADLTVFAPGRHWTVHASALVSQGKNTPFSGYELAGRVLQTFVAGVAVHSG